jgi:hypothetical protein
MHTGWVRKVKGLQNRDSGVVTIYQGGEAAEEVSPHAWDRFVHDGGALAEQDEARRRVAPPIRPISPP